MSDNLSFFANHYIIGLVGPRSINDLSLIPYIREEARKHFTALKTRYPHIAILSQLAIGSDTILTEVAFEIGADLIAITPFPEYENEFNDEELYSYKRLIDRARLVINMDSQPLRAEAFIEAGKWTVDHCDELLAIWNGKPASKRGGTADVIAYARAQNKPIQIIKID